MKQLEKIEPVFRRVLSAPGRGDVHPLACRRAGRPASLELPVGGYMTLHSVVSRAQAVVADLASAQSLLRQYGASRAADAAGNDNGCREGTKPSRLVMAGPALRLVDGLAAERCFYPRSSLDITSAREVVVDDQHRVVVDTAQPRLLTRSRGAPSADPQPKCRFAPPGSRTSGVTEV